MNDRDVFSQDQWFGMSICVWQFHNQEDTIVTLALSLVK